MCSYIWHGLLAGLLLLVSSSPVLAGNRVALVVGNDQYDSLPKLQKAVSDARAVGAALADLGFEVIAGENLSRRDMSRKIGDLEKRIEPGDTALFYFAGHGVALGADNVLLPADMPAPQAGDEGVVRDEGFAVDGLIKRLQKRGAAATLLVLDACRNNPFEASGTRDIGATRGLTRVDAPAGVFVLFSAGTGQTALDRLPGEDADPNSVFTRKLLPLLRRPGLSLVALAKAVQAQVDTLARSVNHAQQPAYYDQIIGEIVLNGAAASEPASAAPEISALAEQVKQLQEELARQKAEEETQVAIAAPTVPEAPAGCDALLVKVGTKEECLAPGDTFRDLDVGPEMVVVPAGTFTMGSPASEEVRSDDEGPRHDVTIDKSFAVGKFEVTFAEWDACVNGGGCNAYRPVDEGWGRGRRPVINVSWDDAMAYVTWLGTTTGNSYRLLSEAEWEYAARAGTMTRYSFGDAISKSQARYASDRTVPVGQYPANAFGLHDMHGSVWEWTEDCYVDSYDGAPRDGSARTTGDCSTRVVRGGSWNYYPRDLRVAYRIWSTFDIRSNSFGFRLGRTLSP